MNQPDTRLEFLIRDLPSPESARRFFEQFTERHPSQVARMQRSEGLFSDVLALASYSPLLATTLIQNPEYVSWLGGKRAESAVQEKEELLESLARFSLTNSQLEPNVVLARFRRRELLRIFLRDIRRLGTIAEITEEISNLADAILEHAVRLARQEMDNRFGSAFEVDEKGRKKLSDVCVVSLGKLGSKELNYSSDIDLLFIYSAEGTTAGTGSREPVTNREYFVKFAETVTQLVGRQTGEGAAYRVDMRLRPHGRVGALALSMKETVRYYLDNARNWEQQVLIRSRASAGDAPLYKSFFGHVEEAVFRKGRDVKEALREVYLSKERIDKQRSGRAFDVKLGPGGIREIEFIAQALQLAHGGADRWLRVPHTLISISRLADRGHLSEDERSHLSNAYDFLRRLEHILQMEHGLQTHSVQEDVAKRGLISAKMGCSDRREFESALSAHTGNVHSTFLRVFGREAEKMAPGDPVATEAQGGSVTTPRALVEPPSDLRERHIFASLEKFGAAESLGRGRLDVVHRIADVSPRLAQLVTARPWLVQELKKPAEPAPPPDYAAELTSQVDIKGDHSSILNQMRTVWSKLLLGIAIADIYETLTIAEVRARQTFLAEASIQFAATAAARELSQRYTGVTAAPIVLALGKLGSGTLDYDSDLDLILAYRDQVENPKEISLSEAYSRTAELFVTLLSAMTREGNLYRVDLRLRPHGKNGPSVITLDALTDYIKNTASIWELLAYVQMRSIGISPGESEAIETSVREALKRRAELEDPVEVRREARSMRLKLEEMHGRGPRQIDIKFGSGGLMDVYFAVRHLHLLNIGAIGPEIRSTSARLDALLSASALSLGDHQTLRKGHEFLSTLDHNIRLAIGRSSRFPLANNALLEQIADRMRLGSDDELSQRLAVHRMEIRSAFERIFAG